VKVSRRKYTLLPGTNSIIISCISSLSTERTNDDTTKQHTTKQQVLPPTTKSRSGSVSLRKASKQIRSLPDNSANAGNGRQFQSILIAP